MKSQTWSPEEVEATEDFHHFSETEISEIPRFQEPQTVSEPQRFDEGVKGQATPAEAEQTFSLAPGYWSSLFEDRLFKARYDQLVAGEVSRRVSETLEAEKRENLPRIMEEARRQGFESGQLEGRRLLEEELAKARAAFEAQCQAQAAANEAAAAADRKLLETLIAEFKSQWEQLLHRHEGVWCDTLIHLLRRFQVENASQLGSACSEWLERTVPEIVGKTPISVYVSQERAQELSRILGSSEAAQLWRIIPENELGPNQIRFEAAGGGVFFDAESGFQKLLQFANEAKGGR